MSIKRKNSFLYNICLPCIATGISILALTGCSHGKTEESSDRQIDDVNTAISKSQTRIEELDARMMALTDKVEAMKIAVDNLIGAQKLEEKNISEVKKPPQAPDAPVEKETPVSSMLIRENKAIETFEQAMSLFKSGKLSDSAVAFQRFIEAYRDHVLAGSAQYYIAEGYYGMGEYALAEKEYQKVLTNYDLSPRVSSALIRLAECQKKTGSLEPAEKNLKLAQNTFPNHPQLDDVSGSTNLEEKPSDTLEATPATLEQAPSQTSESVDVDNDRSRHTESESE